MQVVHLLAVGLGQASMQKDAIFELEERLGSRPSERDRAEVNACRGVGVGVGVWVCVCVAVCVCVCVWECVR
jgi:hypothetical protein